MIKVQNASLSGKLKSRYVKKLLCVDVAQELLKSAGLENNFSKPINQTSQVMTNAVVFLVVNTSVTLIHISDCIL